MTVQLWPEEVAFWHQLCDREGAPAGTIKKRIKWILDNHYRLRYQMRYFDNQWRANDE